MKLTRFSPRPIIHTLLSRVWFLPIILCASLPSVSARSFELSDLFNLRDVQQVSLSPNGKYAALVITRPRSEAEKFVGGRLQPMQRADVWLLSLVDEDSPRQITNGAKDGSSFWSPSWSPNSSAIAMLSTRGSNREVHVFVSSLRSGKLVPVPTQGGVDLETEIWNSDGSRTPMRGGTPYPSPFAWITPTDLLISVAEGKSYSYAFAEGTERINKIKQLWERTEKGEPSYAISFTDGDEEARSWPQDTLVEVNLEGRRMATIGSGLFRNIVISPDKQQAAVICATKPVQETFQDPLRWPRTPRQFRTFDNYHTKFGLATLRGHKEIRWMDSLIDPTFDLGPEQSTSFPHPLWTKDSRFALVLVRDAEMKDALYVVSPSAAPRRIDVSSLRLRNVVSAGEPYVIVGTVLQDPHRNRVYVLDPIPETDQLQELPLGAPSDFVTALAPNKIVGIHENRLVILDIHSGLMSEVQSPEHFVAIPFPSSETVLPEGEGYIVALTDKKDLYRLSITAGSPQLRKIIQPREDAQLEGLDKDSAIHIARSADGTRVFSSSALRSVVRLELNGFLSDVDHPVVKDVPYKDEFGAERTAKIFLPANYRVGARYPTLTWAYIYQQPSADDLNPNNTYFMNLLLALSHGYAVLKPTINPQLFANKGRPYASLGAFVVPAVESAIDYGYSDPSRMYLVGHSYGAYSTYALITQTNVFAAAAAINGPSSLIDEYLSIGPDTRYEPYAFSRQSTVQAELETENPGLLMGADLWSDFDGYIRNSPIRFADKTNTPLLIVHSDSDVFDIHMADAFYLALLRFSKPAAYMRIWGEPHSIDSPGNIAALWKELFQWFDAHKRASTTSEIHPSSSPQ